jgi:hypothetical protein
MMWPFFADRLLRCPVSREKRVPVHTLYDYLRFLVSCQLARHEAKKVHKGFSEVAKRLVIRHPPEGRAHRRSAEAVRDVQ